MTLGILEIGGLFNVVAGLLVAWTGCVLMFSGEMRRSSEEEAEFRRLVATCKSPGRQDSA
jgi:hypothetical protein